MYTSKVYNFLLDNVFDKKVQAYFDLGRPISGIRRRANCSRQWTGSVIISLVGLTSGQQGWTNFNKVGPTVGRRSIRTWDAVVSVPNHSEPIRKTFRVSFVEKRSKFNPT